MTRAIRTAPKYNKAYIYKLCCNDPTITNIYIGSTTCMKTRKNKHKSNCNNEKGKKYNIKVYQFIRNNGGWENWGMYMIEQYAANSKHDLERRERHYYDILKPALNCYIPTRTVQEYYKDNKEHYKQYQQDNKEHIKQRAKQYREDHKEHIKQYREDHKEHIKQYYQDNKEQIKQYYQDNKEQIKQYRNIKHMCGCGKIYSNRNKTKHFKTNQHIDYMNNPFINIYKHL